MLVATIERIERSALVIREAAVFDLPKMADSAKEFYSSSKFLRGFSIEKFCSAWKGFIESGIGVIFGLFDEEGKVRGAIGGICYPDMHSDEIHASEFFWFISDGYRGDGLKLLRAFERWAESKQCAVIRMAHLSDSMPDKLQRVYARLGYALAESQYVKELR